MSKIGQTIVAVQDMVDNGYQNRTFDQIMSDVRHVYGDMFEAIAEEYYNDMYLDPTPEDYFEVHSVAEYEKLMEELENEGVL